MLSPTGTTWGQAKHVSFLQGPQMADAFHWAKQDCTRDLLIQGVWGMILDLLI